ncbi:MAG: hypothetical protein QXI11_05660 [Thermoproteota archaeon]
MKADIKIALKIITVSVPLFLLMIFIVMNFWHMDPNNIWLESSLGQEYAFKYFNKYFNNTASKGVRDF